MVADVMFPTRYPTLPTEKALFRRGVARARLGSLEDAKADLLAVIKADPRNGGAKKELKVSPPTPRVAASVRVCSRKSLCALPWHCRDFDCANGASFEADDVETCSFVTFIVLPSCHIMSNHHLEPSNQCNPFSPSVVCCHSPLAGKGVACINACDGR